MERNLFKNIELLNKAQTNNQNVMEKVEVFEAILSGKEDKKVKLAILRAQVNISDVDAINSVMNLAVSEYVGSEGHNTFVEEHKDTPSLRIVVSDLNDIDFEPFDDQHL